MTDRLPELPEPASFRLQWGGCVVAWGDARAAQLAAYRAGMEAAAQEAEHWQQISKPEHKCGEYIAAAIRGAIRRAAEEPTAGNER